MQEQSFALIDLVAVLGSVSILALVVGLIVRGRLKPRYALLWLGASAFLVLVSVWRDLIDQAGDLMGVDYDPALLFLSMDVFVVLILLHLSVAVSSLSEQVRRTAQELALLRGDQETPGPRT